MELARISAIVVLFWATVNLVVCETDQNDIIKYLERIERRLSRLESSLQFKKNPTNHGAIDDEAGGLKMTTKKHGGEASREIFESLHDGDAHDVENFEDHKKGLVGSLEEWIESGESIDVDEQDLHELSEEEDEDEVMKYVKRKRRSVDLPLTNEALRAAYRIPKPGSMAKCMTGNFKKLSGTLSAIKNKLTKASAMLERMEEQHIQSFQKQLDKLQTALGPDLGDRESPDIAGFWTIDILDGESIVRFYCKRKVGISEELSKKCANGVFTRNDINEATSCCHVMRSFDVVSIPKIAVSQTRTSPVEVTLTCTVIKSRTPVHIFWQREVGGMITTFQSKDGVMTIHNLQEKDSGTYTCKASNLVGVSSAQIFVEYEYEPDKCEAIRIPLCKDIGYSLTSFPNFLGHVREDDAGMEIHQFFPLVKVQCSRDLNLFLCTFYAPMCIDRSGLHIPPCRSLCLRAKSGCDKLMNKYGFGWPESLDCSKLPKSTDGKICLKRAVDNGDSVNEDEKKVERPATENIQCQKIEIPLCMDIGYNYTFMPNILGHISQEEAKLPLNSFAPFINTGCSPDLKFLLCNIYTPMCARGTYLPVCRSVCERARSKCDATLKAFGFAWPDVLDCNRLPSDSKSGMCIDRNDMDVYGSEEVAQNL